MSDSVVAYFKEVIPSSFTSICLNTKKDSFSNPQIDYFVDNAACFMCMILDSILLKQRKILKLRKEMVLQFSRNSLNLAK